MSRDHLAGADSHSEYLDDTQLVLLGIGQQLRRIADALEATAPKPWRPSSPSSAIPFDEDIDINPEENQ